MTATSVGDLERYPSLTRSNCLTDPSAQMDSLSLHKTPILLTKSIFKKHATLAKELATASKPKKRKILSQLLKRIQLTPEKIILELNASDLMSKSEATSDLDHGSQNHTFKIETAHQIQRRGVEAKLVLAGGTANNPHPDQTLIKLIANAHYWLTQLTNGTATSITELAKQQQIDATEISRFLPMAFLAPDIVESILAGSQPIYLTADRLRRMNSLPISWNEQREVLGFAS